MTVPQITIVSNKVPGAKGAGKVESRSTRNRCEIDKNRLWVDEHTTVYGASQGSNPCITTVGSMTIEFVAFVHCLERTTTFTLFGEDYDLDDEVPKGKEEAMGLQWIIMHSSHVL